MLLPNWSNAQKLRKVATIPGANADGSGINYAEYNIVGVSLPDTSKAGSSWVYFKKDGTKLPSVNYVFGYGEKNISGYVPIAETKNGVKKMGLADDQGKIVIPTAYDHVEPATSWGATTAAKDKRYFLLYPKEKNMEIPLPATIPAMPKLVGKEMLEHDQYGDRVLCKLDGTVFSNRRDYLIYNDNYPDFYLGKDSGDAGNFTLYKSGGKVVRYGTGMNIRFTPDYLTVKHMTGQCNMYLFDKAGNPVDTKGLDISEYSPAGFIFSKSYQNGKVYGLLDKNFNVVVPPTYDWMDVYQGNYVMIRVGYNQKGLMTWEGKMLLEPQFESINILSPNDYLAQRKKKYVWLDADGNELLEFDVPKGDYAPFYLPAYNKLNDAQMLKALAVPSNDTTYQLYGRNGKLVSETVFQLLKANQENVYMFKLRGKFGLLDAEGKVIVANEYDRIQQVLGRRNNGEDIGSGLFILVKNKTSALCNNKGEILLPFAENGCSSGHLVSDNFVWLANNGNWEVYEMSK